MLAGVFYYVEKFSKHRTVILNHHKMYTNEDKYKN